MERTDIVIFVIYLLVTLTIGAVFARKQKQASDYFLAGRSMGWIPIGFSIMTTAFSAINYTAFSGEVFANGLYVFLCVPVFALVAIPVIKVIMPFYYRMRLTSAYEYLERRFDSRVRTLASALFIIWQLFWMATVLYVPAKLLSLITGLDFTILILLAGSIATIYTMAGGMKAVMWTDVLQFFVLFGGIFVGIWVAVAQIPGGFTEMMQISAADGLLKPFYPFDPAAFSLNPHIRITLWSCWIGTFTAFLARYGVDQVVVQRYFTAKSLQTARRGFHLNYLSAIVALISLAIFGFAIHVYTSAAGLQGKLGPLPIAYFGEFVKALPKGVTGLIVAGLFAATMSSIDSGANSCSAAYLTDFHNRFFRHRKWSGIAVSRLMTLIFGGVATAMALNIGRLGSIFEIANKIINSFGSPLLAIFLLGLFSKRANSFGMLIGGILGAAWSGYVSFTVQHIALHYYAVLNLLGTLVLCYLFSIAGEFFSGKSDTAQLEWTWKARRRKTGH